jgi:hypothetical protein
MKYFKPYPTFERITWNPTNINSYSVDLVISNTRFQKLSQIGEVFVA